MNNASYITEFREKNGMTLEGFGRLFDPPVNKSTVMRWERGSVSASRAVEIEKVTGIKREKLLPEIFEVTA